MDVAIAGIGITRHGFFPERDWLDLAAESAYAAFEDAGVDPGEVDGGYISVTIADAFEQNNLGALVADGLGLNPRGFGQVGAACAGGLVALQAGVNMIASGRHKRVLVVGVEKISDTMSTPDSMLQYMDKDFEAPAGFDFVDSMALMHDHYMRRYGATPEMIAQFVVQDRWYGSRNPSALDWRRPPTTAQDVVDSGWVSRPVSRAACGRVCDGSSAILLMPASDVPVSRRPKIIVAGIAQAVGPAAMGAKIGFPRPGSDTLAFAAPTAQAAEWAYAQAGITARQVGLAQVHDCFSIMGIIHSEGLGVLPRGEGAAAVADGVTAVNGAIPINTDGGRISLGHPTGATGISVTVENTIQMRGEAGERQLPKPPEFAVGHAMGGNNATSAVAVLRAV